MSSILNITMWANIAARVLAIMCTLQSPGGRRWGMAKSIPLSEVLLRSFSQKPYTLLLHTSTSYWPELCLMAAQTGTCNLQLDIAVFKIAEVLLVRNERKNDVEKNVISTTAH